MAVNTKAGGGPGGPMRHGFQKPKNAKHTLGRVLQYLGRQRWVLLFVFFCVIISAGASVAGTYFLKPLINEYILPLIGTSPSAADFLPLAKALIVLACIYLAGVACTYLQMRLMISVAQTTLTDIRRDLFNHMQDLPISFFDSHTHGELMSRYTNDVDTLREALSNSVVQMLSSGITVVGTFVMMLVLSPVLTLLIVAMLVVMLLVIKVVGGRSSRNFKLQQKAVGEANGYIEELIEGQREVKVFCHEAASKAGFAERNEILRKAATNANTYANVLMPIMGNLSYVNYALTACVGAVMVIGGKLDLGTIAAFLQYTRSFSQPITQISQLFNAVLAALAGAERIFEIIDLKPEQDEGYVTLVNAKRKEDGAYMECAEHTGLWAWKHPHEDGTVTYEPLTGDVRFFDVTFSYDGRKTILKDVSLYAKPGQKIAFVGSTGAGKTTILHTVTGLVEAKAGTVEFEGRDITKMPGHKIVTLGMAHVPEGRRVFSDLTVLENLKLGAYTRKDKNEVEETLKMVYKRFPRLEERKNQMAGTLSGGEQQMLAMGRALMSHPKIILMDEPSMGLSPIFVNEIFDIIKEVSASGTTVLLVEQNAKKALSIADRAYVLETGKIVLEGKADELMNDASVKKAYLGE